MWTTSSRERGGLHRGLRVPLLRHPENGSRSSRARHRDDVGARRFGSLRLNRPDGAERIAYLARLFAVACSGRASSASGDRDVHRPLKAVRATEARSGSSTVCVASIAPALVR